MRLLPRVTEVVGVHLPLRRRGKGAAGPGAFAGCQPICSGYKRERISWFHTACRKYEIQLDLVKRLQQEADGEVEEDEEEDDY